MRKVVLAILALAAFAPFGCSRADAVSRSIAASVHAGVGTRLILADHTSFSWERVCIFGPYTPDIEVDRISGIQGAAGRAYDIRENDGIDVLMFLSKQEVVAAVAHPRRRADFGPELVSKCYARESAVFLVRVPPAKNWGEIGPL
jgi:hypothetical protein